MKRVILLFFGAISVVFVCGLVDKCSNCLPRAHLRVYERRSCEPIMSPECNCPLYYNCPPEVVIQPLPEPEVLKLKTLGENACIFKDKVFAIKESLQIPCRGCQCVFGQTSRNVSGHVIKGSPYGECFFNECRAFQSWRDLGPGCHRDFTSDRCLTCIRKQICPGHEKADIRCKDGERTFRYGEQIYRPEKDLWKICLCDEKFDENDLERSTCWQERCYLTKSNRGFPRGINPDGDEDVGEDVGEDVLMQHCTPVYSRKECCFGDFICNENFNPKAGIFEARPTNLTDLTNTCVFRGKSYKLGEKVDFKMEDTYLKEYASLYEEGECTCRVPPLMTCYFSGNHEWDR